jgi:hypothetical protein
MKLITQKAYNGNLQHGFDKFRKKLNNSNVFRKAHNTLSQINTFALPLLSTGSLVQPQLAPIFGTAAATLKTFQMASGKLRKIKL